MELKLKNKFPFFSREKNILFDWKTFDITDKEIKSESNIKSIFQNNFIGLTLKNALALSKCKKLSNITLNKNFDICGDSVFGKVFGKKLGKGHSGNFQNVDLVDYNKNSLKYLNWIKEETQIDLELELIKIFKTISNIQNIQTPMELGVEFLPATIRVCNPNKGGITHHVGNEFILKLPESKFLENSVILQNQLSFFIVIQEPEKGGELVVFPKKFKDYENSNWNRCEIINEMESLPKLVLQPKVGDLILFQGGGVWHKVADIEGGIDRITLGGILSFTKDKKEIRFWS